MKVQKAGVPPACHLGASVNRNKFGLRNPASAPDIFKSVFTCFLRAACHYFGQPSGNASEMCSTLLKRFLVVLGICSTRTPPKILEYRDGPAGGGDRSQAATPTPTTPHQPNTNGNLPKSTNPLLRLRHGEGSLPYILGRFYIVFMRFSHVGHVDRRSSRQEPPTNWPEN